MDRRLRIAFVSDAIWPYNPGGKEKALWELTRRLAGLGYEVHVYSMKWWTGPRRRCDEGVWLHGISRYRPLYRGRRRSIVQAVWFGLATLRLLGEPFDVMDVDHMPIFPLIGARVVCTVRRKPLVGRWHEVWGRDYWRSYLGPAGRVGYLTELLSFRLPDVIVANSDHTAARLRRHVEPSRIHTVPHGVDRERIDAIPCSRRATDVIFAGRLLDHKRVDVLLEAIALLRDGGRDLRCLVVGEGPERSHLEAVTTQLGLGGSVEFDDFVDDHDELMALFKASQLFVLPSEREGFGLVVLEANACGIPVVTSDHALNAAKDLVQDGQNGYVADPGPDALAQGILDGLALPSGRSFEPALAGRDWDGAARQLAEVFDTGSAIVRPRLPADGRLVPNAALNLLTTFAMGALGFLFWALTARLFTAGQIGLATALVSATSLISYASLLGFNDSFVYYLPISDDPGADITTGLVVVFGTAAVLSVVYLGLVPIWVPKLDFVRSSGPYFVGFVLLTACCAVNLVTDSVFVARLAPQYNLLVDGVVQGGTKLALPLAFAGLGTYGIFAAWGVGAAVAAGASLLLIVNVFNDRVALPIHPARVRRMFRFGAASYVANILNNALTVVLALLVVDRLGASSAGYFYVALQLASLLFGVPVAVATAMFAEGSHPSADLDRLARRAGLIIAATVVPLALILAASSGWILVAFGEQYRSHASGILAVLLLGAPALALRTWTGVLLRLRARLRPLVWCNVVLVVVTCGLALLWVHRGLVWVGVAWLVGSLAAGLAGAVALLPGSRLRAVPAVIA